MEYDQAGDQLPAAEIDILGSWKPRSSAVINKIFGRVSAPAENPISKQGSKMKARIMEIALPPQLVKVILFSEKDCIKNKFGL